MFVFLFLKNSAHTPPKRTRPAKSSPHQHQPKHPTPQTPLETSSSDILNLTTPTPSKETKVNIFNIHDPFLSESKAAISRIEKEAEELERAYQQLHYRMPSSATSPGQNSTRHRTIPQDLFHRVVPSPLEHSCINARVTPMDYLTTQPHYSFTDAPHHSTAQHVSSIPTCDGIREFTTSASMIFTNTLPQSQQPMAATAIFTTAQVAAVTSSLSTSSTAAAQTTRTAALISGTTIPAPATGLPSALIGSAWKTSESTAENTAPLRETVFPVDVVREAATVATTVAVVAKKLTTTDPIVTSLAHVSPDSFRKPSPESSPPEMVGAMVASTSYSRNQVIPVPTTTTSSGFVGTDHVSPSEPSIPIAEAAEENTLPVTLQVDDILIETVKGESKRNGGNAEQLESKMAAHSELSKEEQPIEKGEVSSPPDPPPSNREGTELKVKSEVDDGMDSVMLKYMKIVEKKRKSQKKHSSRVHVYIHTVAIATI